MTLAPEEKDQSKSFLLLLLLGQEVESRGESVSTHAGTCYIHKQILTQIVPQELAQTVWKKQQQKKNKNKNKCER